MLCTQHCLLSLFSLFIKSLSIVKSEAHFSHLPKQAKEPPSAGLQPCSPKPHQGNASLQEFFPKSLLMHSTLPQSCQKLAGTHTEGMAATVGSETWGSGDFCFIIQQLPPCRDVSSGSSTCHSTPNSRQCCCLGTFQGMLWWKETFEAPFINVHKASWRICLSWDAMQDVTAVCILSPAVKL